MDTSMSSCPVDVINLPLSDLRCRDDCCMAFMDAGNLSQALTPWAAQFAYGHWTAYWCLGWLGIFMLLRAIRHWIDLHSQRSRSTRTSIYHKVLAACRFFTYRRLPNGLASWIEVPSTGVLGLLMITVVFLAGLVFIERPYYREHMGYGSPPIAIRSGLIATACTPVLIALGGKANIVTLLTGISYERLNVFHRWTGWIVLVLSLIHTIPFIHAPIVDPYDTLSFEFYGYGPIAATMYSGVPPLAMLVGLVAFSIPRIRRRMYETFYFVHILLGIAYLGLLFWHTGNLIDSWYYLWATLAVLLVSWLTGLFFYHQPTRLSQNRLRGAVAKLKGLPGSMTRLDVEISRGFRPSPGQHCYLRIPSVSMLDNHPFTIMHIAPARHGRRSTMHFLVRRHAGFTKSLLYIAEQGGSSKHTVWVDGPYGGIRQNIEHSFDVLMLVAGGTGITACLPWLRHIVEANKRAVSSVVLSWAIKDRSALTWVEDIILDTLDQNQITEIKNKPNIDISYHITRDQDAVSDATSFPASPSAANINGAYSINQATEIKEPHSAEVQEQDSPSKKMKLGRPNFPALLNSVVIANPQKRIFVIGCGPDGLRTDLANAVAGAQNRVWNGDIREIALHLESFGWS